MYLLKEETFENIWWRIENRVHDLAESAEGLDNYQVVNILRAFSKSQMNKTAGSKKLFLHLEPHIIKNIDKFSSRDLGHLMFAYSVRDAGNKELYKAFDQRLEALATSEDMWDFPTLHNIIYYMMFRENTSANIWSNVIESTLFQDETLPIVYYKPFKYSMHFLKAHFPEWDIGEYTDRFYYAEQYFNQVQMDDYLTSDRKYYEMKCFMNQKCFVHPIVFMTIHNLFNLHYVFHDYKIAINYHLKDKCLPFSGQPNEMMKLNHKILKH